LRLPFSSRDRPAQYKGIAKPERLLKKVALHGAARTERALHAVGMRRFRVSAELAAFDRPWLCHH
jgi:hypothetical protein